MIKGVGIDIIEVARIKGIMEKYGDKFFKRIPVSYTHLDVYKRQELLKKNRN